MEILSLLTRCVLQNYTVIRNNSPIISYILITIIHQIITPFLRIWEDAFRRQFPATLTTRHGARDSLQLLHSNFWNHVISCGNTICFSSPDITSLTRTSRYAKGSHFLKEPTSNRWWVTRKDFDMGKRNEAISLQGHVWISTWTLRVLLTMQLRACETNPAFKKTWDLISMYC